MVHRQGDRIVTAVALLLILLSSCKVTKYIEVPIETHDTIVRIETLVDSVSRTDSVIVQMRGDTVYNERFRYIDRWRVKVDSIYVSKCDTITKIKEVEVEKKLTLKQRFILATGGWLWLLLIIVACIVIVIIVVRRR